MREQVFSTYHPVINFIFYLGALVFAVLLIHPLYLACALVLSVAYLLLVKRRNRWRTVAGYLILFAALSAINPLFNRMGDTVLFVWLKGRVYTWEALCYGMALAALLIAVLAWFGSYSELMTSEKLLYLFGSLAPSLCMIFTMVLRFVPDYQRKAGQIRQARAGIGKAGGEARWREKAESGLMVVSALTTRALEGGIVTADSMRSRGYGSGKRTSFSNYRWTLRDTILLVWLALTATLTGLCIGAGGAAAVYIPHIEIRWNPYTIGGAVSYSLFLMAPIAVQVWEEIKWHSLKSKM